MIRKNIRDEFFEKQPKIDLVEKYKEYDIPTIIFDDSKRRIDTIAPKGLYLVKGEYEKDELLETSWYDFELFSAKNNLLGKEYAIKLKKSNGYKKQEYEIDAQRLKRQL